MRLSGNTVLITGGSSGIGLALAEAFLAAGSTVIVCARNKARLREAQMQHPGLHVTVCDVARYSECRALAQRVCAEFPNLNVLVNNAGIQRDIDFTHGIDAYLRGESEIKINLEAPIVLSGLMVPQLAHKPEAAIINVSSGLGLVPMARTPVYSATKAAVHAFSMALRHQLAPLGIKVFEVVPPAVDTNLNPQGRAARGSFKAGLGPREFIASVMRDLEANVPEIGYGMTTVMLKASRADLEKSFLQINSRS